VLAVGIDLDDPVEVVLDRVLVAGPDGAADAGVEDVFDDDGTVVAGDGGGVVGRAVVDDHHAVDVRCSVVDNGADGASLVVRGDDGDGTHCRWLFSNRI
jgi:hypothetical protein